MKKQIIVEFSRDELIVFALKEIGPNKYKYVREILSSKGLKLIAEDKK